MNKASSIWMGRLHFGALEPLTDQAWSCVLYMFLFIIQEEINSGLTDTDLTTYTSDAGSKDK